jgi:hypothetical protein
MDGTVALHICFGFTKKETCHKILLFWKNVTSWRKKTDINTYQQCASEEPGTDLFWASSQTVQWQKNSPPRAAPTCLEPT